MSISVHCSLLLDDRHRGSSRRPLLPSGLVCSDGLCPHTESQNKPFLHKWLLAKNFVTMVGKVTNPVALYFPPGCEVSRAEPHLTHPSCPPRGFSTPEAGLQLTSICSLRCLAQQRTPRAPSPPSMCVPKGASGEARVWAWRDKSGATVGFSQKSNSNCWHLLSIWSRTRHFSKSLPGISNHTTPLLDR